MNSEIRNFLKANDFVIKKITIKRSILIIETNDRNFVVKKRKNNLDNLFKYLNSRSFVYFPKIIYKTSNYDFYEYINDIMMPREQRLSDVVKIASILHNKTTFYKDVEEDYYKKIYEDILDKINYLENYYNDIAETIEKNEFMSPFQYLFIRNISKIFISLNYAHYCIDEWYKIISEKKSVRMVNIHNNLTLEHYLVSDKHYLISWSKSKLDMPIYDLINLYKLYYEDFDFCDLLKEYERGYPWLLEEKRLFFCLISIPEKILFDASNYELCKRIKKFYIFLDASRKFANDYFPVTEKKETHT